LQGLVIGKKYDSATLGFFNRGKQFPQFIMNSINGAVQSVMLPAMSEKQEAKEELKALVRKSITISAYIVFPMMAGLAGVATPLVKVLLTDAWLPCVPYLQIYCFSFAFYPVHSCNLQAINAIGRSDLFLKLDIIKKSYGLVALIIAVAFFESPIAIAMTAVITGILGFFVNAIPNKKLIDYSYFEQVKDILPSFVASVIMCGAVLAIGLLNLNVFVTLAMQLFIGVAVYLLISVIFKIKPFLMVIDLAKKFNKS
jgi:O-antigen/teichoic acid export membrane protein